jgi:hypothetical protein
MTTRSKFLLIVGLSALFIACKKSSVNPSSNGENETNTSLVGTWRVVSDTTRSAWGAAASENVSVYTGVSTDYYTFNSNGTFKWQQGNGSDYGDYSFSDKQITLTDAEQPSGQNSRVWYVQQLTDHSAVLVITFASPGGAAFQTITLSK